MMRKHKYEGLEHFAQELFRKRICNLVRIPVETIEPYLKGQQGDPRDVIRRMFDGYITRYLVEKGMPREQARLAMGKLCCFRYERGVEVTVTKIGEFQDCLSRYGMLASSKERQKEHSAVIREESNSRRIDRAIPDFNEFVRFITKFRDIVDTGKLAEFYCSKLFDLKLVKPRNQYSYDAESPQAKNRNQTQILFHKDSAGNEN